MDTNSQPVLKWFKRNFPQNENFSTQHSGCEISSSNSADSHTTPTAMGDRLLLSIDTAESSLEFCNPNSYSDSPTTYRQQETIKFENNTTPSNRSPPALRPRNKAKIGSHEIGHYYRDLEEDSQKLRERQFGTKTTLKRLNRYKLRPSLFQDYCIKPEGLNILAENTKRQYYSGANLEQHQQRRSEETQNSKRVRIGLFYTWSFAGQKPAKFYPLGEKALGENPHLDKLWEEAAKTFALQDSAKLAKTRQFDAATAKTRQVDVSQAKTRQVDVSSTKTRHLDVSPNSYQTDTLYESPKSPVGKCLPSPSGRNVWNIENSRAEMQQKKHHTFSDRYPANNQNPPESFYRNVYPYTTLHHGYYPKGYCNNSRLLPHPPPPPPYVYGRFTSCTLPLPKDNATNRNNNDANTENSKISASSFAPDNNVQNMHKAFYASMTGNGGNLFRGGQHLPGHPSVGPVLLTPIGIARQGRKIAVPAFSPGAFRPSASRDVCSGRNFIFAMVLGVTAAIILALAIALFVQINRDNKEYKSLHEQLLDSSTNLASELPNSPFRQFVTKKNG